MINLYAHRRKVCDDHRKTPRKGLNVIFLGKSATNFFLDYAFSIPKSAPSYKPPVNNFASLNHECGIQSFATITGLVVGGQSSSRGQFPWFE